MNRVMLALVTGLFVAGSFATISPASAQGRLNILVMGEDDNIDTIPRGNPVFNRVLASLMNELHVGGFDVWEEVAVTGHLAQGRSRRPLEEILAVAKMIKRPAPDVVVVFSITPILTQNQVATTIKMRIEARLISTPGGQFLGEKEFSIPANSTVPFVCNDDCVLGAVGDHAKILAAALGDWVTVILANQVVPNQVAVAGAGGLTRVWTLVFDGFDVEEELLIEEYLVAFTGYDSHRPIYNVTHYYEISYKSTIDDSKLGRNLTLMLERIGVAGRVFASPGEITVHKIPKLKINAEGM
jgi:hypothetical protein